MSKCGNCGGDCSHCSGCGGALTINEGELQLLRKFAQIPFLPVARRADSMDPIYFGGSELPAEECSLILQCLEKKGLISIDYDAPLKGFSDPDYEGFPCRGSAALTLRGQQVLDLLEIQGITE